MKRSLALTLSLLVLVSGVGGPLAPVGTASADGNTVTTDCTIGDIALGGLYTVFNPEDKCGVYNTNTTYEQHVDAYARGESLNFHQETYISTQKNYLQDRRSAAWSEAKIAVVNSLNDNETQANATDRANESVRDYYTPQVKNLFSTYSASVSETEYLYKTNESWVDKKAPYDYEMAGFVTYKAPLPNGSNATVRTPVIQKGGSNYKIWIPVTSNNPSWLPENGSLTGFHRVNNSSLYAPGINNQTSNIDGWVYGDGGTGYGEVRVTAPPGSSESAVPTARPHQYARFYDDVGADIRWVEDNIGSYTNETYADYQEGELDTDNILNPTDLASRTATAYNESGYYAFAAVELAQLGYNGSFNHSVTVVENNTTHEGYLFYTADDVGTFETNTTYDPENLNGTVYLAAQSNNSSVQELSEPFEITGAQNPQTGAELANVSTQKYTYETTNASKLQQELEKLQELRQEYERQYELAFPSGDVGIPDAPDTSGLPSTEKIIAALAIGGGVLFFLKEN